VRRIETGHPIDQVEKEIVMRNIALRCQVVCLLAVSVFYAQSMVAQESPSAAKGCSNATLRGSFGYTSTGTLLDSFVPPPFAGPFGEIGRQTFDGKGNTNATATVSSNGNISTVGVNGTYTVNSDCTGSMTLNIPDFGATVHANFVIDDGATELRAIGTDAGVIETRVYKKQCRGGREE
jgi:hypothetical protein